MIHWLGIIATLVSATLLYMAAPHQRLLAHPSRAAGRAGLPLLATGLVLLLLYFGTGTAIFVWFTCAATIWSIVPLAAVWFRHRAIGS